MDLGGDPRKHQWGRQWWDREWKEGSKGCMLEKVATSGSLGAGIVAGLTVTPPRVQGGLG